MSEILTKRSTTRDTSTKDHVGHSPFTMIYSTIVKYAWQHKCPVNRSAFTYWENDIPSRIDLGKNKYGGPFTNEEVEDTKTFFCILLLLFSLLGLHLSTNGFSVTSYLIRKVSSISSHLLLTSVCSKHLQQCQYSGHCSSPPLCDTTTLQQIHSQPATQDGTLSGCYTDTRSGWSTHCL